MTDNTLYISDMKQGNSLAFIHLYRQYAHRAFLMSYKYLGNKQLAEDAVQELFVKLWEHRSRLRDDEPLDAFLFTTLKHLLLDTIRRRRDDLFLIEHNMEVLELVASDENSAAEPANDARAIFAQAFRLLSPRQQQIVRYKLTGKLSNTDIAEQMGISVNTVKAQYYQSLKRLRQLATDLAYMLLAGATLWTA